MHGTMNQFTILVVLSPRHSLCIVFINALALFKRRNWHVAIDGVHHLFLGGVNYLDWCGLVVHVSPQFELRISAVVGPLDGMTTTKSAEDLSDPKSNTAIDLFALLEL